MDKHELRQNKVAHIIRTQCGMKRAAFAKIVGISESYVARMMYPPDKLGHKRIGEDMVAKIAAAFGIDPAWFDTPYDASGNEPNPLPENLNQREFLGRTPESARHGPRVAFVPEFEFKQTGDDLDTPRYSFEACGTSAAYRVDWLKSQRLNPTKLMRFKVNGDSMVPLLFPGDSVLINTEEKNIVDGLLYAIRYGTEMRIKYVSKRLDGTLVLRNVSAKYPDEQIAPGQADIHISIIGRVRERCGTGGM